MNTSLIRRTVVLAVALIVLAIPAPGQDEPFLEAYTLDSLNNPRGVYYEVYDRSFGGGSAQTSLKLRNAGDTATLVLRIYRRVPPGTVTFALLVDRIQIQGFVGDEQTFDRSLEGFVFGDSAAGDHREEIEGIPLETQRIVVSAFGNYE